MSIYTITKYFRLQVSSERKIWFARLLLKINFLTMIPKTIKLIIYESLCLLKDYSFLYIQIFRYSCIWTIIFIFFIFSVTDLFTCLTPRTLPVSWRKILAPPPLLPTPPHPRPFYYTRQDRGHTNIIFCGAAMIQLFFFFINCLKYG